MRTIATILAMASAAALAQAPSEFRWEAPVTLTGTDALNRLTLPFEAYREGRPDFADLRLFNAQGEALPIAFAGEPEGIHTGPTAALLPIFPISGEAAREGQQGSLNVIVKSDSSGTIVSVQGRKANLMALPPQAAAWLADVNAFKPPIRELVIGWNVHAGTEVVKVDVDASDDLKSWHRVASKAPLMHLEQGGAVIDQSRVDLHGMHAKYLRIAGEPAAFRLEKVSVVSDDVVTRAPRSLRAIEGAPGSKAGEYVFDLGARLPVEAVRVTLPTNTVAPFTLATRENDKVPWRTFASGTFYNLVRDGVTLESPAIEVFPGSMRHVTAQLDARSPPLSAPPRLEVQWRPAQLIFVARGEGPYRLEFGHRDTVSTILAVSQLIPGYEAHAEMKLSEAHVGEVKANAAAEPAWRAALGDTNPRSVVLWVVLVVAVLVMAGMAYRLARQMKATPPPGKEG